MSLFRKILMTLMVISGIGSTISAGTFASYNASTTNQTSTFATGSLVLGRQVNAATMCMSVGAGTNTDTNANAGCSSMFSNLVAKLGDAATTVDLTIKNDGSLPGVLSYASSVCANGSNGTYYIGSANLCDKLNVTIQEYTSSLRTTPTSSCVFPAQPSSSCPALSASVAPTYLPSALPSAATSQGAIAAGASRWFRLTIQYPNTGLGDADATQGRKASFALTWSLA